MRLLRPITRVPVVVVLVTIGASAGLLLGAVLRPAHEASRASTPTGARPTTPIRFSPRGFRGENQLAGRSVIARARTAQITVYPRVHARHGLRTIRGRVVAGYRVPLVMLARAQRPGWVRVWLPVRPDRSSGWVRRHDVRLMATSYRIVVSLAEHRLEAWEGRTRIAAVRIAVGRSLSPTPTGTYFVTDILRPPNPHGFYGPYALGLSGYSPVYTTFGSGDGQIGIHGTNDPSSLGRDVSHGCIRVANQTIMRLARSLPLGTPVLIRR